MPKTSEEKIPCSVGILTYNSEKTLRRALESVQHFSDIIISDGGSTDQTLAIAAEYGASVIEQIAKHNPGPEPRHPIVDFAAERNQLLQHAQADWFLWIDSDEYISDELRAQIAEVVQGGAYDGCQIPMHTQSPDGSITYALPYHIYQTRLVRKALGHYERPIHERFVFDHEPKLKQLTGAWYVPISKPNFKAHRWAVNYRLRLLNQVNPPRSVTQYLTKGVYKPLRNAAAICFRLFRSRLTTSWRQALPLFYFRNRLYSQWVTFKIVTQLYVSTKCK